MTVLYIILAILFFGVLIIIHEAGHFTVAKLCGVTVNEFSVGMGPALAQKVKGETTYSLRLIPFGGYCAMLGEDGECDDSHALNCQPVWKRFLILAAGSFMNFLLGLVIVFCLFANARAFASPVIAGFLDGCPYQDEDGLQVGDRFLSIDGHPIYLYYDVSDYLDEAGENVDLVLERDGKRVTLKDYHFVPVELEGQDHKMYGFQLGYEDATFGTKLRYTWNTTMEFGRWVWKGLGQLFSGEAKVSDLSGPVGVVDMMADTASSAESVSDALFNLFYLGAFIAVNLAMMNMLPIPGLDGGHIFLMLVTVAIEAVTRKKLDPKYAGYINTAGLLLLLALMAYVMFHDIVRVFFGG